MSTTWQTLRSAPPEPAGARQDGDHDDDSARMWVLAAAVVANLSLAIWAGVWLLAPAALVVVVLGHRYSRSHHLGPQDIVAQSLMAAAMVATLGYLLADLFVLHLGDIPQLTFTLLLQAISSFGLRSRRNLFSHLWLSLVLLYLAGLFAWNSAFLVPTLLWCATLVGFLGSTRRRRGALRGGRLLAPWAVAWLALGVAVFTALPQPQGSPIAVPLLATVPDGGAANGLTPNLAVTGAGSGLLPAGGINLRARGTPGEQVVFHVRGGGGDYWRAYALEDYDGENWTADTEPVADSSGIASGLVSNYVGEALTAGATVTQTFFLSADLGANVIGTYPIDSTFVPTQNLTVDSDGTIESANELTAGTTYAVRSAVRDTSAATLEDAPPLDNSDVPSADLALPSELPDEVYTTAQEVMANATTEYGRVTAVVSYLQHNFTYNLDAPPPPQGADAVADFLFVQHQGFCEQFASALAVMLRTQSIPARLVVGYAFGAADGVSGDIAVTAADAHAWVEVYFPATGWVTFDATPGGSEGAATAPPSPWTAGADVIRALTANVHAVVGVVLGAAAIGGAIGVITVLRRPRRRQPRALRRYARAQFWLWVAGAPCRQPGETPRLHLARLRAVDSELAAALGPLALAAEVQLYAGSPPVDASLSPLIRAALRPLRRQTLKRKWTTSPSRTM